MYHILSQGITCSAVVVLKFIELISYILLTRSLSN
nr:MAG TPA: hypothetical protein [Caudoviricetes sp.]